MNLITKISNALRGETGAPAAPAMPVQALNARKDSPETAAPPVAAALAPVPPAPAPVVAAAPLRASNPLPAKLPGIVQAPPTSLERDQNSPEARILDLREQDRRWLAELAEEDRLKRERREAADEQDELARRKQSLAPQHEDPKITIGGLEGLARQAARRLGVTPRITGFRREYANDQGSEIVGVPIVHEQAFTANLFFNLLRSLKVEFTLPLEAIKQLIAIDRETDQLIEKMHRFAPTSENARRVLDEATAQIGDGPDLLGIRGNLHMAYQILSHNLSHEKNLLKTQRAKRTPTLVEIGRAIDGALNQILVRLLEQELTRAAEMGLNFAPSTLLATVFGARELIDSQISMVENTVPNGHTREFYWGIISEYLNQNKL